MNNKEYEELKIEQVGLENYNMAYKVDINNFLNLNLIFIKYILSSTKLLLKLL